MTPAEYVGNYNFKSAYSIGKFMNVLARQKEELEAMLARIKRLEGVIPICAYCKKIRDNQNSWQQLEKYISDHSEALFTHGICPECTEEQMKSLKK